MTATTPLTPAGSGASAAGRPNGPAGAASPGGVPASAGAAGPTRRHSREDRQKWLRFTLLLVITVVVLVPVLVSVILSLTPSDATPGTALTLENFATVISGSSVMTWMVNSLQVAGFTVLVSVLFAAPAAYAISRSRSGLITGYSLVLFIVQSLPIVTSVIPLFILFANIGLVDNLFGVSLVYIGSAMAVATWMLAGYFDSIPVSLEEAAWIDGCSVFGSFVRIVLRNSLPGVLSAAIFTFLLAWNDYLVALVFLRSDSKLTLPMGMQSFFQQNSTDWGSVMAVAVLMMIPPILVFTVLNRYFSVGGIGGSLAGR
jgi:multiple sugar transport system permease protein